jgi:hypothetical protein
MTSKIALDKAGSSVSFLIANNLKSSLSTWKRSRNSSPFLSHFQKFSLVLPAKMPPPTALIIPAVTKHTATVIMAHGLGDSGAGWASLAENWRRRQKFQEVKFIFPNAPNIPISVVSSSPAIKQRKDKSVLTYASAELRNGDARLVRHCKT